MYFDSQYQTLGHFIIKLKTQFKNNMLNNCFPVEIMGSIVNFGASFAVPAGILCENYGARVTSLVSLIIATLGYLLLYSTTLMIDFYKTRAWLQYIYFFLGGKVSV